MRASIHHGRWRAVLGIDPGVDSGCAIVTVSLAPILITHCHVDMRSAQSVPSQIVRDLMHATAMSAAFEASMEREEPQRLIELAIIEDQFLGEHANVQSLKRLTRIAGRWEEACLANGIPVSYVMPSSWQARELGMRGSKLRSGVLKGIARAKMQALWPPNTKKIAHHEADAALMARHAAIELFLNQHQ